MFADPNLLRILLANGEARDGALVPVAAVKRVTQIHEVGIGQAQVGAAAALRELPHFERRARVARFERAVDVMEGSMKAWQKLS